MTIRRPMELHIRSELLYMMQEVPIEKIKVRALVDRAKIGRSTFYLYYDAVDSVLEQIEGDFFDDLRSYMPVAAPRRSVDFAEIDEYPELLESVARGLSFMRECSLTVVTLCSSKGDPSFKDSLSRHLAQVVSVRLGVTSDSKISNAIPTFVIEYVPKGWLASVLRWLEEQGSTTPDELAKMFFHLLQGATLTCEAMDLAKT